MALFGLDLSGIFSAIKGFLGPFGKLFDLLKKGFDHVVNVFGQGGTAFKLKDSVLEEIDGWKNFKQDIRFKQRAIVLESAIQKTRDLIEGIPESWHAILDILKQVREKFSSGSTGEALEEASAAAEDIESSGLHSLLNKFPRLARGLEKALGVIALVVDGLESVAEFIDHLQTIVDELKRVRKEIEKLDSIFLQQGNKRKTLKLADGSSIRVRRGHLHLNV